MLNVNNMYMSNMEALMDSDAEAKTEKFQMMWGKSTLEAVDEYGFANRIRTRAEAIRRLVRIGLANVETKKADATAS